MNQAPLQPFEEEGMAVETVPSAGNEGVMSDDDDECLELPASSGNWFIRNKASGSWEPWTQRETHRFLVLALDFHFFEASATYQWANIMSALSMDTT
jgi:hypothetical protein